MRQVDQNVSIRIIENTKLTCLTCLGGVLLENELIGQVVICHQNTEDVTKNINAFCLQGMWLVEGKAREFKEAFNTLYKEEK